MTDEQIKVVVLKSEIFDLQVSLARTRAELEAKVKELNEQERQKQQKE